ncbi:MAG TPA: SDR family oxidoreductase [Thermoanaerobaculia bacterium]|nr:SDR family oxidoreductase [Thermoanaerobaculia bacterium]
MRRLLITGGTGGLGSVVVPRLSRDYDCIVMRRGETPRIDGALFGVVSLAGAFAAGSSTEIAQQMTEANLYGFTRALDLASPNLEDGGRIIAISSAASLTQPAGLAAYSASKAALNAYILTLAHELAKRRITANALLPTALATAPMRAQMRDDQLVPLERVAEWIAFLLSDNGAGVTGQLIKLDA